MRSHRPLAWLVAVLVAAPAFGAFAEEVSGIVKAVDTDAKKIVVTPTGKVSTVDVVVNAKTELKNEAGESIPLKELKEGDGVGIALKSGVALKINVAVKPSELTGHVKSVASNRKSFVVTETGTSTDVTVAVNGETSIVTTEGKKLEVQELKKGDGVGIAHTNSLASRIIVYVKPAEKDTH
jgi:hypothetical protein